MTIKISVEDARTVLAAMKSGSDAVLGTDAKELYKKIHGRYPNEWRGTDHQIKKPEAQIKPATGKLPNPFLRLAGQRRRQELALLETFRDRPVAEKKSEAVAVSDAEIREKVRAAHNRKPERLVFAGSFDVAVGGGFRK